MLFRQLEYFVAVAQERHFARAAEKCYVSQPALSSAIAKLERELNVTLINRGHSFEGLTREGERLVVWAKRILAEHAAFKAEVDAVRSGITGTLRLGTVPTASTTASLVLSAFCSAHPLAKVQVCSRLAATELYRRLREFELDAVIVHPETQDSDDVDLVPLYERAVRAVVAGGYAAAGDIDVGVAGCRATTVGIAHCGYAGPPGYRRRVRRPRGLGDPAGRNRFRCFAVRTGGNRQLGVHRSAHLAMGNANERADGW